MTQVPRPLSSPAAPVVPEAVPGPAESPTGQQDGGTVGLVVRLAKAIDSDRESHSGHSVDAALRVLADTELMDALVAFRQARQSDEITDRDGLSNAPTGTVVRTPNGHLWSIDHGPEGEWTGARTHIHHLLPAPEVFYPANFDLSMPLEILHSRTGGES